MKEKFIKEDNIKKLVYAFYNKVRSNKDLKPIFINVVGDTDEIWEPHLQKMCNFWSSIMLSSGKYFGNPHQIHKNLPKFDINLFDIWLFLFIETAYQIYTEEIANKFAIKSKFIAERLKSTLYGI